MFKDERPLYSLNKKHYDGDWVDREYIILFEAINKTSYKKSGNKWWLPGNNSTCNEVKKDELNLFEEKILLPAFGKTIDELKDRRVEELSKLEMSVEEIKKLQDTFRGFLSDENKILDVINNLNRIKKLKVLFKYGKKSNVDKLPVVSLRKKLIEHLIEDDIPLTSAKIDEIKKQVDLQFEKNVFHVWKSHFRVLYPFYYDEYKDDVLKALNNLVENVRADLDILDFTKKKVVDFDGAQNQGSDRVWFAIYNSSYKTQKLAKQLFFSIDNGQFIYGLRSHKNPQINKSTVSEEFKYDEVLDVFKEFIEEIKNDDCTKFKEMNDLKELIEYKKQVILQGPPGTGKTYKAKDLAEYMIFDTVTIDKKRQAEIIADSNQINLIQFHPAFTYEDFIRGIVTEPLGDKINYVSKNKLFLEIVDEALINNDKPYVLIIDEINRANLPSVLGELIYALEYREETFKTMYADKDGINEISIPNNLYIIGTMNTADRSVSHLDYALRRRFAFYDILPQNFEQEDFKSDEFKKVSRLFVKEIKDNTDELEASEHLSLEFQDRPQDIWLGHSYFFKKENTAFSLRLKYEIVPLLQEYVKDGILNNTTEVKKIIRDLINYQDGDAQD